MKRQLSFAHGRTGVVALGLSAAGLAPSCEVPLVIRRVEPAMDSAEAGAATLGGVRANAGETHSGGELGASGSDDQLGGAPDTGGVAGAGGAAGAGGSTVEPLAECELGLFAREVSAGEYHACATDYVTSALYCWGLGSSGQLGNGTTFDQMAPSQVQSPHKFSEPRTGTVSTCAVSHDQELFCFGDNFDGVLADGTDQGQSIPVLTQTGITDVAMSAGYVIANTITGVHAWGSNTMGQLGLGDATVGTAVRTESYVGSMEFISLAAGYSHACAIDLVTNLPYCAGSNQDSRLGIPGGSRSTFTQVSSTRFRWLSAGYDRTCGLTTLNELHCWGHNEPVTFAGLPSVVSVPTKVSNRTDWDSVSVGFDHLCATTNEGRLLCVGDNSQDELGMAGGASTTFVEPLPDLRTFHISAGRDFTCALREPDRAIVCFGSNEKGKLGRGSENEGPGAPALVCLPPL